MCGVCVSCSAMCCVSGKMTCWTAPFERRKMSSVVFGQWNKLLSVV